VPGGKEKENKTVKMFAWGFINAAENTACIY
jgi:hypothetical protein